MGDGLDGEKLLATSPSDMSLAPDERAMNQGGLVGTLHQRILGSTWRPGQVRMWFGPKGEAWVAEPMCGDGAVDANGA